jgi:glycosyltransferase involved in cell wall biosynthesis
MKKELKDKGFKNLIVWTRGVSKQLISVRNSGRKHTPLKVLYAGRVSKEKNLEALCDLQELYDITIVGDGPYLNHLKNKYKKVNFTGYKFGKELQKVLNPVAEIIKESMPEMYANIVALTDMNETVEEDFD